MQRPLRPHLLLPLLAAIVIFLAFSRHLLAQTPEGSSAAPTAPLAMAPEADDDDAPESFLSVTITVDARGNLAATASYAVADETKPLPSEIKRGLQSALGCTLTDSSRYRPSSAYYSGSCRAPFVARGLLREGRISTEPIKTFASLHNIPAPYVVLHLPDSDVHETIPEVRQANFSNSPVFNQKAFYSFARTFRTTFSFFAYPAQPLPSVIVYRYGYSATAVKRAAATLAVVLVLPLALFFWLSRKALSADAADKAVVWFSYIRMLGWILNGTLLAWWIALDSGHVEQILGLLVSSTRFAGLASNPVLFEAIAWIPPTLIWLLCYRMSHPVQQKLRGLHWTKRELTLQALYITLVQLFPIAMFLTGLRFLATSAFRTVMLWWVGAFLLRLIAARALLRHTGMMPQALSSGDLRDRAFAMAERLGVKLQQIYLIPSGKGQIANAFARTGNTIAFTDFLLQRMSQREVDYVLAHELTHLRLKHPAKLGYAMMAGIFLGIYASGYAGSYFHQAAAVRYFVAFVIISLLPYFFSRRFEYSADAGAVDATNDPRAAISALFKLSELNMMPIHWSRWREKWLTHPSSLRRARAIAQKANIPFDEIPAIAREGAADTQSYRIPDTAAAGAKIHSTQHTTNKRLKLGLLLIAVIAFVPSLLSLGAMQEAAPLKWVLFAAAVPATFGGYLLLMNYASQFARGKLHSSLSQKLANEGIQVKAWNGVFVGFAPAAAPRFYDKTVNWDIGYLFFLPDCICYCGEETKFALRPSQITAIKLADGMPGLFSSQRIYIAWRDDERGTCGVFNLGRGTGKSNREANKATWELTQRLQAWWKTPPMDRPGPPQLAALSSPQIRAVTALNPKEYWKPKRISNELVASALFAAMGAVLCGLPFHLMAFLTYRNYGSDFARAGIANSAATPGAGWYAVAVAVFVRLLTLIPHLRYRDLPKLIAEAPAVRHSSTQPLAQTKTTSNDKVPTH